MKIQYGDVILQWSRSVIRRDPSMKIQYGDVIRAGKFGVSTLAVLLLCACATTDSDKPFNLFPTESLAEKQAAAAPPPAHLRLDIGIEEFDPNYTLEQAKNAEVFAEVRKAEAKYFPLRLRNQIQKTDFWRGVWLVPAEAINDVKVKGKIIKSDGKYLELMIVAVDATGKVLLNKTYEEEATEYDYSAGREPFANLFKTIAEDLTQVYGGEKNKVARIKRTSDLRFANWIAPDAFAHHVDTSGKRYKVVSLPKRSDPVYQQAIRLREYDALFFDKLQDYYDEFYSQVGEAYARWSQESYLEIKAKEEAQSDALAKGIAGGVLTVLGVALLAASANSNSPNASGTALVAGAAGTAAGGKLIYDAAGEYKRSKIHDDALQELGASLEGSIQPHTLELEGRAVQLQGSIEKQYLQWHQVLQEQYRTERKSL